MVRLCLSSLIQFNLGSASCIRGVAIITMRISAGSITERDINKDRRESHQMTPDEAATLVLLRLNHVLGSHVFAPLVEVVRASCNEVDIKTCMSEKPDESNANW